MYTFSKKLKTTALILMALGLVGIVYGFLAAPKTVEEAEKIIASSHHEEHNEEAVKEDSKTLELPAESVSKNGAVTNIDTTSVATDSLVAADTTSTAETAVVNVEPAHESEADVAKEKKEHAEHVLHQLQNKPWAALYIACIFFMLISLGVLAFYAIQQVAQAGWSPVLFRVMQGITAYLPVGSVIFFILLVVTGTHLFESNHLFSWMAEGITEKGNPNYDEMIAGKSGYLNFAFWISRAAIFLLGWNLYRYISIKNCLSQDEASDNAFYKKNFKLSAAFLVFFIVSESVMAWDWLMSFDPHWFSTLFGWYVFASFFVSAITTISMVTLYLKSKGYLENVNSSHIHDLSKFMFGFSVFWTYLWFSQFMLIWYANIPEEITYFKMRIDFYTVPFWGAVVMNFVFPILVLINTDFKRVAPIIVGAGVVILCGHYIDFFNMVMPGTVGDQWFIGVSEIASVLFFLGLFIFVVFTALTKAPLVSEGNPYIEESKHFHY
jgi:hypothetical protein